MSRTGTEHGEMRLDSPASRLVRPAAERHSRRRASAITVDLYTLLQICDSLFPSGAFAHSFGLEGVLAARGSIAADELPLLLEGIFVGQLLRSDGLLGAHAHRAMRRRDVKRVCAADRELSAFKLARELREASTAIGRSFLTEVAAATGRSEIHALHEHVQSGDSPGNHATMFLAAAAAVGAGERDALLAWGYQSVAQMTGALLRLGVLGHRRAQSLLAALRPVVLDGVEDLVRKATGLPSSFAPLLEIASMRHERQYSRLFRS